MTNARSIYSITLSLPAKELRSNARVHWTTKHRAKQGQKEEAYYRTLEVLKGEKPRWKDTVGQAIFYFSDRRYRDRVNLNMSLKTAIDGIEAAGLLLNDRWLTMLPPVMRYNKANPRVVITIKKGTYDFVLGEGVDRG